LKIKREAKIAIIFVAALILFFWGFNFLKGRHLFTSERTYYAVYKQVNGLVEANPVVINGYKVGIVNNIYFHPDGSGRLIVKFNVDNDIRIPYNTVAKLYSSDILGSRAIELVLGDSKVDAASGDTLKTQIQASLGEEVSIQMMPIKQKFENVMLSIDSVLVVIRGVFDENTRKNLALSFESIKLTIKNLEHTTYNIDTLVTTQKYKLAAIISNVESITANIKKNNDKISNIIVNFSNISDTIAKAKIASTINNADKALSEFNMILGKVNRGEGSLGMLVNNDSLYKNLNSASEQLNLLVEDVKLNPQRYISISVFGKKSKPYKNSKKEK
jgi:phospholipid/cholesterol/gamma-HCH transport system substrate-binding protein